MEPNQCGSMRIQVLVRLYRHKKLNFYIKKILYVGNRSQNMPTVRRYKNFLKGWKSGFFVAYFGQFSCSQIRIRIHIPSTASDPRESNKCRDPCGSGCTTLHEKEMFFFSFFTTLVYLSKPTVAVLFNK
jgi:hypothetical protein